MDKKALLNIGKSLFKDISDKLIRQGKETLSSSKKDILEKGKEIITTSVNEKIAEVTDGILGKKKKEASFVSSSDQEDTKDATPDKMNQFAKEESSTNDQNTDLIATEQKYHDAEQFEKNLSTGLNGLVQGLAAGNPAEAAAVLNNLVNMAAEVSKFTEVQKTKRKDIEAQRDVYVEQIRAQKEVMLVYLEKSFDERRTNFEKLFTVVDDAIASNNIQQLAIGLQSINTLAATSPFKELSSIEATQQALTDKNHLWDF